MAGLAYLERLNSAMLTNGLRNLWLIALFFVLWPAASVYAATIQVSVDRNPIKLNESFQITFSASEQPDGSPDFEPLREQFDILNQQRSSNVSWVNGKVSRTEQWLVSAMPKRVGTLTIPAIAFGSDVSKPLKVMVTDNPQAASSRNDEIFLEVEATPEQPYVQSQVLYTLRIYFRVQITHSTLSDLDIKDALVEQLGEDSTYRTQIDGVEYGVLERKYAIFPQQSGVFTIAPLSLNTEVVSNRQSSFNGFFSRKITETRRVTSKAVTLNVLPVPQSFIGQAWLSAESLELTDSWSDDTLQSKVGEPLTRTIRLAAKGATVGQLPELASQVLIDGLKTYPDQPALNEEKQSDGLLAVREEKVAYIPSQAGDFTLPVISIPWFNTRTQTMEIARLPAVTVHALPAAGGVSSQAPVVPRIENETTMPSIQPESQIDPGFWPWLSAGLASGWLLHALWLYRRCAPVAAVDSSQDTKPDTVAASAERELKKACAEHDPQAARQALLSWGRARFGSENLQALASRCSEPLASELLQLNRRLYANQGVSWEGSALWRAFNAQGKASEKQAVEKDSSLEPLFKL